MEVDKAEADTRGIPTESIYTRTRLQIERERPARGQDRGEGITLRTEFGASLHCQIETSR